jgi:transcriptional regulator with XRE-family HTH domain
MIDRIQELLKSKNLSPSQFADEIGIQRSGMSHLLSGRNKPSLDFVFKVLKRYPDVTAEWLLHGYEQETTLEQGPGSDPGPQQTEIPLFIENNDDKTGSMNIKTPGPIKKINPGVKAIEKIVVFYTDKTFREYSPEL